MTWIFILLDVFILTVLVVICGLVVYLWNKKGSLTRDSIDVFRNEKIYEMSKEEQKRKAHIEDIVIENKQFTTVPTDAETVDEEEISFSAGYGGLAEPEAEEQ